MNDITQGMKGYIEKPKYIQGELVKTVDTIVDELILAPPAASPDVVPKSVYDDLYNEYTESVDNLAREVANHEKTTSLVANLEVQVSTLEQETDSANMLQSVAENQTEMSNERYSATLMDFQTSLQKGTKESIQRVSLEAQTRGLQAQKLVLTEQLKITREIVEASQLTIQALQGNITYLSDQLTAQQAAAQLAAELAAEASRIAAEESASQLSGAQAESTAVALGLMPGSDGDVYYKFTSSVDTTKFHFHTSMRPTLAPTNFGTIEIQNLRDDDVDILSVLLIHTGDLVGMGPFGFTNAYLPSTKRDIVIKMGGKESLQIYASTNIGGEGTSKPEPNGSTFLGINTDSAKSYTGTIQAKVTYTDGKTATTGTVTWSIQKNINP